MPILMRQSSLRLLRFEFVRPPAGGSIREIWLDVLDHASAG